MAESSDCELGSDCWDCGERQVVTPSPKEMGRRRKLAHVADTMNSAPTSSWAVVDVAPTCECCAVLLNKAPGELCHIVPVWELKDWVCPGCTPAVETSSLCNRVVYNVKTAISSTDPYFNPSKWREFSGIPGVGYQYKHYLPGASPLGSGILMGYYRDPACAIKPSPPKLHRARLYEH